VTTVVMGIVREVPGSSFSFCLAESMGISGASRVCKRIPGPARPKTKVGSLLPSSPPYACSQGPV
jgi:hypothetical protein